MTPTLQQLEQAQAHFNALWQQAHYAAVLTNDPRHARVADAIGRAADECRELARDERLAMELDKQRAVAPASTQQGSQRQPVKTGTIRRRR